MLIFHASDLHYCERHLKWVDKAFGFACLQAIAAEAQIAVLSGDSFDAALGLHEPAVNALMSRVRGLADHMPVCVLQGTYSHDRLGSLAPLRHLGGRYPVLVADKIGQAAWCDDHWVLSGPPTFEVIPPGATALFSLLPSVNRGAVAAAVGVENVSEAAGEAILHLCQAWAPVNLSARAAGIPTILVTHGTVNGCITECAHAMVSPDHEFGVGSLLAAECSAAMVGHIHAHQSFRSQDGRRLIAYPGSITKLIYGHRGQVGYLMWDVAADAATFAFHETPSREMLEIEFDGPPDIEELRKFAAHAQGAFVRLRYVVGEEHRHSVDAAELRRILTDAGAAAVKIEPRINPVQRTRAAGIGAAESTADKVRRWCELTETAPDPLLERLTLLESGQEPGAASMRKEQA
jgi:exonuclease SbcD